MSLIIALILKEFSRRCHGLPLLSSLSQNALKDDRTLNFYDDRQEKTAPKCG